MIISEKLKERFCKDCNIPIKIYKEPYFMDRLKLYDPFYNSLNKWNLFLKELKYYSCEQDYFEEYNKIKDLAINYIKSSPNYQNFNEIDMNQYSIKHQGLPHKDVFHSSNDGRTFISIDMKKANFSSLQNYSHKIFGYSKTWEDFMHMFTDNEHIVNSKYIRQVILGNCNPKRHITYEKYLMDKVLSLIIDSQFKVLDLTIDNVVFFSNDEIVFDITDMSINSDQITELQDLLNKTMTFPLKAELFVLHKIQGTDGYYKEILNEDLDKSIEFKCLDSQILPFVIRQFNKELITDSDKIFIHDGILAQFVEIPEIIIPPLTILKKEDSSLKLENDFDLD